MVSDYGYVCLYVRISPLQRSSDTVYCSIGAWMAGNIQFSLMVKAPYFRCRRTGWVHVLDIGTPLAKWQKLEAGCFVLFALLGRMCLHGGFLHHSCTTVHSSVEKLKRKTHAMWITEPRSQTLTKILQTARRWGRAGKH